MNISNRGRQLSATVLQELEEFCLRRRSIFYPKTDLDVPGDTVSSFRFAKGNEIDLNQQTVADLCSSFFGKIPASVVPLYERGTYHALYKIVFPDNECYIVRASVPDCPRRAFEFLVDGWVTEVLRPKGVPTVPVYRIDLSREDCPFDYEILGEAPGMPLTAFEDKDTQDTDPYLLSELGHSVAKIHSVETDGFGLLDVRSVAGRQNGRGQGLVQTWKEYILMNLDEHMKTCFDIQAVNRQERISIVKVFDLASHLLEAVTSCLLHGDLGNHNVFSDGKLITAIIDWEDCLCGDPVFDIAFWGTFCRDRMLDPFLQGYRSARHLTDDFEIRYWLYYLRIALSKTVLRYRFRLPDRPGRPPASRRIQKGLERLASLGWS